MALLNSLLQLVVLCHHLLRRALANLLAFLSAIDRFSRAVLRAVADFSWKLTRALVAIGWTMVKLSLFLLPGVALIVGLRSHPAAVAAGVVYLALIVLVGLFYRPAHSSVDRVRVNVTWLSFFPLSWSQDEDFAPILSDFTTLHDDLALLRRNSDSDLVRDVLSTIVQRLGRNMRWTRECVGRARTLRSLQRKLKDPRLVADVDDRVLRVQERLRHNLSLFHNAKAELAQVNLALDDHRSLVDTLNPIEEELVLLEEFRKRLQYPFQPARQATS